MSAGVAAVLSVKDDEEMVRSGGLVGWLAGR